ncbi:MULTISPECIES: DNA-3-methyladenine glycosylase [unclassified Frankia]
MAPTDGAAPDGVDFYDRPVLVVAPALLGATVRHGPVAVRITEVEAYGGLDDPASHAYRGPTPRAAVMFGPPGRAYVYLSYGVHWCLNVVCGPVGSASAVLLRSGEVVAGRDLVAGRFPHLVEADLARGPGRLGRALAVTGALSGTPVTGAGPITVALAGGRRIRPPGPPGISGGRVCLGPRVGIRVAAEWPWRFWLAGEATVSGPRSPRRPR